MIVVGCNDMPVIKCPHHQNRNLDFNLTSNNTKSHPANTLFYCCNIMLGPSMKERCGFNVYPEYPYRKYVDAVVAAGASIARAPTFLRYNGTFTY